MTPTPRQIALADQAMATARDIAADGVTTVFVDFPDGQLCAWCNCPTGPTNTPPPCTGCLAVATDVLRVLKGSARHDIPVCAQHRTDALHFIALAMHQPQEPRP